MSHSLGSQPGNSRLGPSKVPESTGKRLRRFVCTLLFQNFLMCPDDSTFLKESFPSQCSPLAPSRHPDVIAAATRL
jgi:hypothetical protein